MMGQRGGGQDRLFYSFNLDDHVPRNHLLRGIHQFLDLSELRRHLAPFYSHTGRPSIDPELMVTRLAARRHPNVAAAALANKTARMAWAMLRNGTDYQADRVAS